MSGLGALTPEDPRHLGRYQLLTRLGAGGMGVVYLAQTPGGAKVAVKALHAALVREPGFLTRFGREVEALRRVNVAGTARVLDADLTGSQPYLVTEFLEGDTLDERISRGSLMSGSAVTDLLAGLAETLVALNAHSLVHRDLKPSNVLLSSSGPKLLDFGIAAALDETSLTGTGLVVGSAGWLAPEQIRGHGETAATDMFALGCVAVFAATGNPPFGRGRPDVYATRLMSQPPDLTGVPVGLVPVLTAMLDKDPNTRPTAQVVLTLLGRADAITSSTLRPEDAALTETAAVDATQVIAAPGVTASAPPKRTRRRALLGALVLLVAAGLGGAVYALGRTSRPEATGATSSPAPSPSASTPNPDVTPSTSAAATVPTFTPAASNPFTSEVWGDGKVAFTQPRETSYQSVDLTQRTMGPATLLAPAGWAFADESIPSDHDDLLLYDPANPAARIEVSGSGCVGCIVDDNGKVDPLRPLPAGTVSSFLFNHGLSAGFQEGSADGYAVNGVLSLLGTKKDPQGYVLVRLALPATDTDLARRILNSIGSS